MAKQFSTCFGNSPCTLISLTSTRSPSTPKNLAIDFWDPCEVYDQIGSPLNDPKDGNSPTISSFGGWSKWVDLPTHLLDFPVLFCFSEISEVRVLDGPTQEIGDLGIMHGRARWWIIVKTAVKGKAFCSKIQMICTWWRPWCLNFKSPFRSPWEPALRESVHRGHIWQVSSWAP